ncbi:hypothetical protein ACI2VK_08000 [Ralstonia nicotianae]|uniref:hypothetical protein n=1 Tax=Ralstonia pseudosolanacearum TaxID=1310165 RepID=UPI0013C42B73|nr:hypothetical protein [Ralstonia pseudosolanacearum]MBX9431999.1 hypothetical protein [Ralstonia pseudosolanacearum]MCF1441354.1 hypothetical protein [Ralstonia solanacearum]
MASQLLKALYETAQDFVQVGLMDSQVLRELDAELATDAPSPEGADQDADTP